MPYAVKKSNKIVRDQVGQLMIFETKKQAEDVKQEGETVERIKEPA